MELKLCTWREVEVYLDLSSGIMIPLGSIEQHGPNGLLGTDAICSQAVARHAAERTGVMVGPAIELTVAQFNLAFAGTIHVRASVLAAVIHDYVKSLAVHGFRRFYFVNGHGANISVANAAFHDIYAARSFAEADTTTPELRCRLRSWWEFDAVCQLRDLWFGTWEGVHATPSEIAITQSVYPEQTRSLSDFEPRALSPEDKAAIGGDRHYDAHHQRTRFADGTLGSDPRLASPERGASLLEAAASGVLEDYQRFVEEA